MIFPKCLRYAYLGGETSVETKYEDKKRGKIFGELKKNEYLCTAFFGMR